MFSSVILFSVFSLADLSNYVAKSHDFTAALTSYFMCEALGYVPAQCDRSEFTGIYTPYTTVVAQVLLTLIPLTILNYIVKWKSIKKTLKPVLIKWAPSEKNTTTISITLASVV